MQHSLKHPAPAPTRGALQDEVIDIQPPLPEAKLQAIKDMVRSSTKRRTCMLVRSAVTPGLQATQPGPPHTHLMHAFP